MTPNFTIRAAAADPVGVVSDFSLFKIINEYAGEEVDYQFSDQLLSIPNSTRLVRQ